LRHRHIEPERVDLNHPNHPFERLGRFADFQRHFFDQAVQGGNQASLRQKQLRFFDLGL
jgi:hypothetical protein